MWVFELDAFRQERARQTPATGEAGDRPAEPVDSSQRRAVDASSVPIRRAKTTETMGLSLGVAVDASSPPRGRRKPPRR